MANNVKMYDMLISCPVDVEEVIENFNQQFIDTLGIGLRTNWKKSLNSRS